MILENITGKRKELELKEHVRPWKGGGKECTTGINAGGSFREVLNRC